MTRNHLLEPGGGAGGSASGSYETQIFWMKKLAETFDSIGYGGIGRQCLTRCIAAFEGEDKTEAITEYRKTIGSAANFASALTDLDSEKFLHS